MPVSPQYAAAVNAVLDGRASDADVALVESSVLADADCRRHYVDAMNVHAALLWDNVVAASPVPDATRLSSRRHRRVAFGALTAATAALLLLAIFAPREDPQQIVQNNPPPAVEGVGEGAGNGDLAGGGSTLADGSRIDVPLMPEIDSLGDSEFDTLIVDRRVADKTNAIDEPPSVEITSGEITPGTRTAPAETLRKLTAGPDPREGLAAFIDQQLANAWSENEVSPAPEAAPSDWLRRASLDVRGRIPTPAELDRFIAADPATRRAATVEEMLAGGEYADNFATVWTNLLVGRSPERAEFRNRLKPYLSEAFALNRSWGEIAGELVAADGPQSNPPTNFLLAHMNNEAVPATAITSRVLLGRQVQCTQCHAHPFNDWQQDEFWRLNAFFAGCDVERRGGELALVDRPESGPVFFEDRRGLMKVAYPVFDGREVPEDRSVDRRDELAGLLVDGERTQLAEAMVNRVWAHFHGAPFTQSVDDLGPHSAISHPVLFDRLTRAFVASGYDVRQLVSWVTGARSYALASQPDPEDEPQYGRLALFTGVYEKPLTAEQLYDSLLTAAAGSSRRVEGLPSREEWVAEFYAAQPNEENTEESTFEPSAARALELMNGRLVTGLLDSPESRALAEVAGSKATNAEKAAALCRMTLGREPTEAEAESVGRLLRATTRRYAEVAPADVASRAAVADVFWAYVNSSSFAVNR